MPLLLKNRLPSVIIFICALSVATITAGANERAMWVWSMAAKIVINANENDRADFYSFAAAPHGNAANAITTVFMTIGLELLENHPDRVREFIADSHSRGLRIEYLDGDPLWALTEIDSVTEMPYNNPATTILNKVIAYNNGCANDEERFDGIQFDVEPYLMDRDEGHPYSWDGDQSSIWDQYIASLHYWQNLVNVHNNNATPADNLRFGVVIPFWWDSDNAKVLPQVSHKAVQDIVDYIAILAYDHRYDVATGLIPNVLDFVRHELEYAEDPDNNDSTPDTKANSVYVGLEAIEVNWKERSSETFSRYFFTHSISFFAQTNAAMETIVDAIINDYENGSVPANNFASFAGTAHHYYEDIANGETAYRSLRTSPTQNTSNHAPYCLLINPSGGEIFSGTEIISYRVYDPDGDALAIRISVSSDGGATWQPLPDPDANNNAMSDNDGSYAWDLSNLTNHTPLNTCRIKLEACETGSGGLTGFDVSDYNFTIAATKTDTVPPGAGGASLSVVGTYPLKRFSLNWKGFTDDTAIKGYYYSLHDKNEADKAFFTRALSGILGSERAGEISVSVWAVDPSGNQSNSITKTIMIFPDLDGDNVADADKDNEMDTDGDGISDLMEKSANTNPLDNLSIPANRGIAVWKFDQGSLVNSVSGGEQLDLINGSLAFTSLAAGNQAINLSAGDDPVQFSVNTDITSGPISALTIEMWIRPEGHGIYQYIPLVFEGDIDRGFSLILKNDADYLSLRYYYSNTTKRGNFVSINHDNDSLFDGQWHHVAFSYNGPDRTMKLFVDGIMAGQTRTALLPSTFEHGRAMRFFDARSQYDNDNGLSCDYDNPEARSDNEICVPDANSAQFENNLNDRPRAWANKTRYIGQADNIKVTLAAVGQLQLGYYTDYPSPLPDVDDDGLNDNWESVYFNDLSQSANDDYDGDGFSNLQEFARGSDPTRYELYLRQGWNLISLSRVPENNTYQSIFAEVIVAPAAWTWEQNHFVTADRINPLQGYWVYLVSDDGIVPIKINKPPAP